MSISARSSQTGTVCNKRAIRGLFAVICRAIPLSPLCDGVSPNGANNQNRRKSNGGKNASAPPPKAATQKFLAERWGREHKTHPRPREYSGGGGLACAVSCLPFLFRGTREKKRRAVIALASPFARVSSPLRFPCLPLSQRGRCQAPLPPDG